ncbi:hypothetical protein GCM10020219_091170 [Nonomuraea dietziae]
MKMMPTTTVGIVTNSCRYLPPMARAAALAEVRPEHMTAKATMSEERLPEGELGVEGGPRRPRVLGDQLHVGHRGEGGDDEADEERDPEGPADPAARPTR